MQSPGGREGAAAGGREEGENEEVQELRKGSEDHVHEVSVQLRK